MAEGSMETLARSQLETLYQLGILKRSPKNKAQYQCTTSERDGKNKRHDAFLAALPPPSMICSLSPRNFQASANDSESASERSQESSCEMSPHSLVISRQRQQHKSRQRHRLNTSSSQSSKQTHRALRTWIRQWKTNAMYRREKKRQLAAGNELLKQNCLTKWAFYLVQRRQWHEMTKLFEFWKASKALSKWAQWRRRCFLLRRLLDSGRCSFIGRLIQQRVWRRWLKATKQRKFYYSVLARQTIHRQHRLVRCVWTKLRIHTFQARHESLTLRDCLKVMRNFCTIQENKRYRSFQYQLQLNYERKRRLLQRWRAYTNTLRLDRRLSWRVQYNVRRRRFLLLWCKVARDTKYVHQLRVKLISRKLCQHFQAWNSTTRAIKVGDQVRKNRAEISRKNIFRAFKDQTSFSAYSKHVTLMIKHRRLAAAVNYMYVWTMDIRRMRDAIDRVQKSWQIRLLRSIWVACRLVSYRRKVAINQCCKTSKARYLSRWKHYYDTRRTLNAQIEKAEALHAKFCCKQGFSGWKRYYIFGLKHGQRLDKAQSYYRLQLLKRGFFNLWRAAYQNAQTSLQAKNFCYNLRLAVIKRHFCAWSLKGKIRRFILQRVRRLQQRSGHKNSIDLNRRIFNRWVKFVTQCRRLHQCKRCYQVRRKQQALHQWHRQANLKSRLRICFRGKNKETFKISFAHWNLRVGQWKKIRAIDGLARKIYEKKVCTRVIREWRVWSLYLGQVHKFGDLIKSKREKKLKGMIFFNWREKVSIRQCMSRLRRRRECGIVRICFTNWLKRFVLQKVFSRKLKYFRQVYGLHPASSILSRLWYRWQRRYMQIKCVKDLSRNVQRRHVRRCWSLWKDLHTACFTLRIWHQVASTTSSSTKRLRMRLRCFQKCHLRRLQRWMMDEWKSLIERRRRVQERQLLYKAKLHDELKEAAHNLELAAHFYLSLWFRRWNNDIAVAKRHFYFRLCSKVISLWWKSTVHLKQEKVLINVRQTTNSLLHYHPRHRLYANKAQRRMNKVSLKQEKKVVATKFRAESMRRMRRMLDPVDYASYLKNYQASDGEIIRHEHRKRVARRTCANAVLGHSAAITKSRRSLHSEQTNQSDRLNEYYPEGGERMHSTMITTNKPCSDKTMICKNKVEQNRVPYVPATSNRKSLKPYIGHSIADFGERLQCDQSSPPPFNREQLHLDKVENSLPLFDNDILGYGVSIFETARPLIAKARIRKDPVDPFILKTTLLGCQKKKLNATFDPSADSRFGLIRSPALKVANKSLTTSSGTKMIPETSLTLNPIFKAENRDFQSKPRVGETRNLAHKKQIKVIYASRGEARPLADILDLNDGADVSCHNCTEAPNENRQNCDASLLETIIAYYADGVIANSRKSSELNSARIRVCFRLARDLALFQNDFYIDEFMKVYDASYNNKAIENEQTNLKVFLEQLVECHPAYRKYLHRRLRSASVRAFDWLAQYHLNSHLKQLERAKGCPRQTKAYWIWSLMPSDMGVALEKIFPVINKYMGLLGQLFLRQAVQSSLARKHNPQDYRMTSSALVSLMKQVQVFPQLFHRRELEDAVHASCCSSPETEELNFPEFIETLVRCSCVLRWCEPDGGKEASETKCDGTVAVIKFVMLIFAMEGRGSVLRKRNDDVAAILGFIGQQQKKNQVKKLYRFRKMLADNKRRTPKARQIPSLWNHVRPQYCPMLSSNESMTLSQDTFNELTESWDEGIPRHVMTDQCVFNSHSDRPFKSTLLSTDAMHPRSSKLSSVECARKTDDQKYNASGNINEASFGLPEMRLSTLAGSKYCGVSCRNSTRIGSEEVRDGEASQLLSKYRSGIVHVDSIPSPFSVDNIVRVGEASPLTTKYRSEIVHLDSIPSASKDGEAVISKNEDQRTPVLQATGLAKRIEKDEFLHEIIDCIGDVELLLSQSEFPGSNYSKLGRKQSEKTHSAFPLTGAYNTTNSIDSVPSLSDLADDTSFRHDWQQQIDDSLSTSLAPEVHVCDPLLNHLTDIERFTESNGDE